MSNESKSNVATIPASEQTLAERMAELEAQMQALAEREGKLAAAEADLAAREAAAAPKAAEPFVPVLTYVVRPTGWYDGDRAQFASSEPHVAVKLQRYRNGNAKWITGGQSGFTRAQLEALRDHADTLLAAMSAEA